ncbi:hypothetical protein [Brevundimonas sp.]|uniref:hypothetical protein n=1 Tax=Brevundimonas sp. TaxID=1871086 RepID=UPI003F6ED131
MFRHRTVFVIGAGCSKNYKFDVGSELLSNIVKKTAREDEVIASALVRLPGGNIDVKRRLTTFSAGLQSHETIDQYLDFIQNDQLSVALGKIAIARCILEQEHASGLTDEKLRTGVGSFAHTWVSRLISRILRDLGRGNIAEMFSNLTFICFNYDRIIEQIAYHQIRNATNDEGETRAALSQLRVLHPYGSLGNIPWQGGSNVVEFGRGHDEYGAILMASKSIRTFTETVESKLGQEINVAINNAEQVCFNGFGYIRQNMTLLRRDNEPPPRLTLMNQYLMPNPERVLAVRAVKAALVRNTSLLGSMIETDLDASEFMNHWLGTIFADP